MSFGGSPFGSRPFGDPGQAAGGGGGGTDYPVTQTEDATGSETTS